MHKLVAATAAALVVSVTVAQARLDTRTLTCAQVNALVAQEGQVMLNTGPNTFDRFVSENGFCDRDQVLQPRVVQASDTAQCPVRWTCFTPKRGGN